MPQKGKKKDGPRYVPQHRYTWIDVRDPDAGEDDPYLRVRVRADLTVGEANTLVFESDTATSDVWDRLAPFVTDWNLDEPDGTPVPPPSEAGGAVFERISNTHFWQVFTFVKLHSAGKVDAKPSTPSRPTVVPDGDITMIQNASSKRAS